MEYLCLGYLNKLKMDALPGEKIDAIMLECQPHLEELDRSGHMLMNAGIAQEATTLKGIDGKIQVGARQLIQSERLIGSVFILEARNLEEAIQLASLHPTVQVTHAEQLDWEIEIRAIDFFDMKD